MRIFVKPKPNEKFFRLSNREASHFAMELAKEHGENGKVDWELFREWTRAHAQRNRAARQLTLA